MSQSGFQHTVCRCYRRSRSYRQVSITNLQKQSFPRFPAPSPTVTSFCLAALRFTAVHCGKLSEKPFTAEFER